MSFGYVIIAVLSVALILMFISRNGKAKQVAEVKGSRDRLQYETERKINKLTKSLEESTIKNGASIQELHNVRALMANDSHHVLMLAKATTEMFKVVHLKKHREEVLNMRQSAISLLISNGVELEKEDTDSIVLCKEEILKRLGDGFNPEDYSFIK